MVVDINFTLSDEQAEIIASLISKKLSKLSSLPPTSISKKENKYLSLDRARKYINKSPDQLRKLVREGKIRYIQDGYHAAIFFREYDLDEYMQSNLIKTKDELDAETDREFCNRQIKKQK